jgi:predicted RND superfamily exporter protein
MDTFPPFWVRWFDRLILSRPRVTALVLIGLLSFIGNHARDFRLDASSETLILEHDADLAYARQTDARYGTTDFLVVAYTPHQDLFAASTLERLKALKADLQGLERVTSVMTILDVPLLESPPVPLKELAGGLRTLLDERTERSLAPREFQHSPLYRDLLVSADLRTTALVIQFAPDTRWRELRTRRDALRDKADRVGLDAAEKVTYVQVQQAFQAHRDATRQQWHATIEALRRILDAYAPHAQLHLGGVDMIADDMLSFIRNDLKVFGTGVFLFLVGVLGILFRSLRWVVLPVLCCTFSTLTMMGILGLCGWEVTVISSNFVSLQLIITMAITIHLIVRYRELFRQHPEASQRDLVRDTVRMMLKPCTYAALTTVAGFASLIFSDIKPVITFGWMMMAGIAVSMAVTFLLFPAILMLIPRESRPPGTRGGRALAVVLERFTEHHGGLILLVSAVALAFGAWGMTRLKVENAFIDYFKKSTEIYQGMRVIDQKLGGTTPLDVVIDLEELDSGSPPQGDNGRAHQDVFADFEEFDAVDDTGKYWFTADRMARIEAIHDYLDHLPQTGKVLSLATAYKIAQRLNGGQPLDNFALALLFQESPQALKQILVDPYVSVPHHQIRLAARIVDSQPGLRRNELLDQIRSDLTERFQLAPERVHLTGMMVLYNNMLQSLFQSQVLTLGATVMALMAMFWVLFRSLRLAVLAIFPNLLSIAVVLGFMGWAGIPLDMMTITIAAISVGIAVDDTIHYIHRFGQEFKRGGTYLEIMRHCHGSVGHAMYYTSVTIISGFSILVLSSFIPTIYFGLLTSLAMAIALVAALTLLPALIVRIRPFGPDRAA